MGGGSIQVPGFKRRRLSHKIKGEGGGMCPQVLLFSDMDRSAMSWAEGRAGGLCGLRKDAAYHQATPQP